MKKYNYYVFSIVLSIALIATGVWGYTQHDLMTSYRDGLNHQYQRFFYDMKDNIETVQSSLSKVLLSESKEQNVLLLSQVYQQSFAAQDKISQLPIRHSAISNIEKLLNQIGGYSYSLIEDLLRGKDIDEKQMQSLFLLQDYTTLLSGQLENTFDKVLKGNIDFKKLSTIENEDLDKTEDFMIDTGLAQYEEEQLTEYPEIIYDGPFSDQIINVKAKGLGDKKFTEEEAKEKIIKFFNLKNPGEIVRLKSADDIKENNQENKKSKNDSEKKGPTIDSYTFSLETNDENLGDMLYVGVSKMGGKIVWAESPRNITSSNISKEEAIKIAQKKMKEKGIENMEPNYSETYNNTVLVNFAYTQDEVTVYPDLIKMKIALDNGDIVGFDAAHYLKNHVKRDIPKPNITSEEARAKVKYDFDVESIRLTIIPDRAQEDLLCYEFKGRYKGWDYIVYINALNGRQEKILRVIKGENGILMI